jgi:hypothetical protein
MGGFDKLFPTFKRSVRVRVEPASHRRSYSKVIRVNRYLVGVYKALGQGVRRIKHHASLIVRHITYFYFEGSVLPFFGLLHFKLI